jgi:SSS family transporter
MNQLSPSIILIVLAIYFTVLYMISYITSKGSDNNSFFTANKNSSWILVAIGMIGASLSGVTFISIPGAVGAGGKNMAFSWMQMVMGFLVGYLIIATVLMPIYYRLKLVSIYEYLEQRLGFYSYKTGAAYFILSRIIGASFRLFLVAMVFHKFIAEPLGVSFLFTVICTILLIWLYTFKGGIKTIVWTDSIQTVFMLLAVVFTIYYIMQGMDAGISDVYSTIQKSDYSQMFFFDEGWSDPNNFFKQFISGILITIVMTGLDQDMMQKNLTCKSLREAQKNIFLFSVVLIFANILFLSLGALLYIYAAHIGIDIPAKTDQLYPIIALEHLPVAVGIIFIIGLIAAAYSSADSALTALTTSFCIDFLDFNKKDRTEAEKKKLRILVHIGFSLVLLSIIVFFNSLEGSAVINKLFEWAGYTYGPILGLFAFGIFTKRKIKDGWVIPIALVAPVLSYFINYNSKEWFGGLELGFLIIAVNGLLTFIGLMLISKKSS